MTGTGLEILRTEVGSTAHGLALDGQDDRDEMGIFLEPATKVIGLGEAHTIVQRDRPEGVRSQPGDLDLVLHPLRKWMRLALNGNPTILAMLFAPVLDARAPGLALRREGPDFILSRRALDAYLGYLTQQKERLLGLRGQKRTKRPELVEAYGYDTKYAAHALRLGLQGIELATTGRLELPMEPYAREFVLEVRRGDVPFAQALSRIEDAEGVLTLLKRGERRSVLPAHPDRGRADQFLIDTYTTYWEV